jgi:glycopeptide antibiotics resistance protein
MTMDRISGAFLLLLGIALELLQGCTEVRTADPFDVIANATGLAIGLAFAATPAGKLLAAVDSRLQALARHARRP